MTLAAYLGIGCQWPANIEWGFLRVFLNGCLWSQAHNGLHWTQYGNQTAGGWSRVWRGKHPWSVRGDGWAPWTVDLD